MNLKAFQEQFLSDIDGRSHRFEPQWQMDIYRNSMITNLTNVLKTTYPVCLALVGDAFFHEIAKMYISKHNSQSQDVTFYGRHYAEFLKANFHLHNLEYLPDVAAFEWACHIALEGPLNEPMDLVALAAIPEAEQHKLVFKLPKASTLFSSSFPILRIWEVNQPQFEGDQTVHLDEGPTRVFIYRKVWDLCIVPLSEEEWAMLNFIKQELIFEKVCDLCIQKSPLANIANIFAKLIQKEWINDFKVVMNKELKR